MTFNIPRSPGFSRVGASVHLPRGDGSGPRLRAALLALIVLVQAVLGRPAAAGPVVLGGDDLTDHGAVVPGTGPVQGWLYIQRALESMAPLVTRLGNDGSVAALGAAPSSATSGDAGAAIGVAAAAAGIAVRYFEGPEALAGFFADLGTGQANPAIVWIAGTDASNNLDFDEGEALTANAEALAAFVNSGGGLMAHGSGSTAYGWLTALLPGLVEVPECESAGAVLTAEGIATFRNLGNADIDTNAGPCHSHFEGDLGGLEVLAQDAFGFPFIIGGVVGVIGFDVIGVVPATGGDTGPVSVTIRGGGFADGATVVLSRAGQPDVHGQRVHVEANGRAVRAVFDLTGRAPGTWAVTVTNPDGELRTFPDAFTLERGGAPRVWVDVLGRDRIRPAREEAVSVLYGNAGKVDADEPHFVIITWPADAELTIERAVGVYGDPPSPPIQEGTERMTAVFVPRLPAQSSRVISARLRVPVGVGTALVKAAIVSARSFDQGVSTTAALTASSARHARLQGGPDDVPPVGASVFLGGDSHNPVGHQAVVGRDPVTGEIVIWDHFRPTNPQRLDDWRASWGDAPYLGWATPPGWTPAIGEQVAQAAADFYAAGGFSADASGGKNRRNDDSYSCAGLAEHLYELAGLNPNTEPPGGLLAAFLLPGENYRDWSGRGDFYDAVSGSGQGVAIIAGWLEHLSQLYGGLLKHLDELRRFIELLLEVVNSIDPNDKVGSVGVGTGGYVSASEPLRYAIFFENLATATAPAQEVVISDQLDGAAVDLDSVSLGPVTFGSQHVLPEPGQASFSTAVDLRPDTNLIVRVEGHLDRTTGLLTWRFTTIDPATSALPEDPLVGFLPPNRDPPAGEGSVVFTVMPRADLATGATIDNAAAIVFDQNAPIETGVWRNSLDATRPTSAITDAQAAQCAPNLRLTWQGADQGAGVGDYRVWVSEDGSPFQVWLADVVDTTATFEGEPSRTYGFYSTARDQTRNQEDAPAGADAVVTVSADGTACDDGNACSSADACHGHACVGRIVGAAGAGCELDKLLAADLCGEELPKKLRKLMRKKVKKAKSLLQKAESAASKGTAGKVEKLRAKVGKQLDAIESRAGQLAPESCQAGIRAKVDERRELVAGLAF